ncbi:MAG: CYTH domain-containing protein [Chloroflexota bacterium]
MADFAIEAELKYEADPATLDSLAIASRLGPSNLGPVVVNDEDDRYLDTSDGRLEAVAWACRLRSRRVDGTTTTIVSLKGPVASMEGALHRRPEIEGPATASLDPAVWPASAARDHLNLLSGGLPLRVRLTLRQRRRERPITLRGRPVGLLSLDEVEVVGQTTPTGRLCLVELERAPNASDADFTATGRALAAVGLVPDARSKLERAIRILHGRPTVGR